MPNRPGHEWSNSTSVGWAENRRWCRDGGNVSSSLQNQSCTLTVPWMYQTRCSSCVLPEQLAATTCCILLNLLRLMVVFLFDCSKESILHLSSKGCWGSLIQFVTGYCSLLQKRHFGKWHVGLLRYFTFVFKEEKPTRDPLVDQWVASHWNDKYWVTECEDSFFSKQKDWARTVCLEAMRQSLPYVLFCLLTCFEFGLLAANACSFMIPLSRQDSRCECKIYALIVEVRAWRL